jgi:hypothetical protein
MNISRPKDRSGAFDIYIRWSRMEVIKHRVRIAGGIIRSRHILPDVLNIFAFFHHDIIFGSTSVRLSCSGGVLHL